MYRYMISEAELRNSPVGFLDPHVVSDQTFKENAKFVEDYMTDSLLAHRNKEFILLPNNQGVSAALVAILVDL